MYRFDAKRGGATTRISKSEVSRICGELDTVVAASRTRPLTSEHRYSPAPRGDRPFW